MFYDVLKNDNIGILNEHELIKKMFFDDLFVVVGKQRTIFGQALFEFCLAATSKLLLLIIIKHHLLMQIKLNLKKGPLDIKRLHLSIVQGDDNSG